jgi:monovalent cation/hydrogen antiporter
MHENEMLLLALMVAVAGLGALALVLDVPYPILLVLGGLVLGFVPGMPPIEFPPDLVLVVFLPPLLYWAAFMSSPRDLRADLRATRCRRSGWCLPPSPRSHGPRTP